MNLLRGLALVSLIFSIILVSPLSSSFAQSSNSPPVLKDIPDQTEDENDSTRIMFFATDPDEGDILTFSTEPYLRFATLVNNYDGSADLLISTGLNDQGTYNIKVTVTDNGSPQLSDSQTFKLTILDDGDPSSPELLMEDAVDQILQMVNDDKLNEGQATSLIAKIDAAAKKLEADKNSAGAKILQAFINQVEAFIKSGVLTPAEGQPLIDTVQAVLDTL